MKLNYQLSMVKITNTWKKIKNKGNTLFLFAGRSDVIIVNYYKKCLHTSEYNKKRDKKRSKKLHALTLRAGPLFQSILEITTEVGSLLSPEMLGFL